MGSYFHVSALGQIPGFNENYSGVYAGLQVSRKLSRSFSCYANYTGMSQSASSPGGQQNVFSGISQMFAVGLTYSPGPIHPGHF